MSIEFTDNTAKIVGSMKENVSAFLYEVGGELTSQIQRNSRVDTGETKGSYTYRTNETADASEVIVGSPNENAIWEEYGTGEYALNGNGRKGGWTYKSKKDNKFYHTTGKKPNKPMKNAFDSMKPKIKKQLSEVLSKG